MKQKNQKPFRTLENGLAILIQIEQGPSGKVAIEISGVSTENVTERELRYANALGPIIEKAVRDLMGPWSKSEYWDESDPSGLRMPNRPEGS